MGESKHLRVDELRYSVMFGGEGFLSFWGWKDFAKRPGWKPITTRILDTVRGIKNEESVAKVAAAGINAVWTDFSMGRGPAAEESTRHEAKDFIRICHDHGIRVFLYVQAANIFWPDFLKEIPGAVEWLAEDAAGKPVTYLDGAYWFRYYTCINNPGWVEYTKEVIREALSECGADGIHLDNIETLPRICHCRLCLGKFRTYLERNSGKERPGATLEAARKGQVLPPRDITGDWLSPMNATDPAVRAWARFRCRCLVDFLSEIQKHIHRLNPEALLSSNTSNLTTVNKFLSHAVDFPEVGALQDFLFVETDTVFPRMELHLGEPRVITNARTYKWGASLTGGKPVIASFHLAPREGVGGGLGGLMSMGHAPSQVRLLMAEGLANGGYGTSPISHEGQILTTPEAAVSLNEVKRYNRFLAVHAELYRGVISWANVAVFNSQCSLAWRFKETVGEAIGVEQTLIQCHIPFDIITDCDLGTLLGRYRLLILPNTACMSDAQIEAVMGFVETGGTLIASGMSSLYDEENRIRGDFGLRELFDKKHGRGEVMFFPHASFDGGSADWPRLPQDWEKLRDAIRSRVSLPVLLEAPPWVYMNLMRDIADSRRFIHLVNYAGEWDDIAAPLRLEVLLPAERTLSRVRLLSPDHDEGEKTLEFSKEKGRTRFSVLPLHVYGVVVLEFVG